MKEFKCILAPADFITCTQTRWRPEGVRIEMHELECPEGTFVLLSLDDARAMAAELIRLAGEG